MKCIIPHLNTVNPDVTYFSGAAIVLRNILRILKAKYTNIVQTTKHYNHLLNDICFNALLPLFEAENA